MIKKHAAMVLGSGLIEIAKVVSPNMRETKAVGQSWIGLPLATTKHPCSIPVRSSPAATRVEDFDDIHPRPDLSFGV